MILTTYGHRRIPTLWRLLERNLSTKEVRESLPATASQVDVLFQNTTLPAPKIRALISLYHQADSWVTPENLYQKIDEAFVPSDSSAIMLSTSGVENMASVSDMKNFIKLMRSAPKMAQWDSSSSGREDRFSASEWSESGRNKRDLKVIEALYGVAYNHDPKNYSQAFQAFLPGLEVVQESASSAIQDHEDDRKAEDLQDVLKPREASHSENLPTHG